MPGKLINGKLSKVQNRLCQSIGKFKDFTANIENKKDGKGTKEDTNSAVVLTISLTVPGH